MQSQIDVVGLSFSVKAEERGKKSGGAVGDGVAKRQRRRYDGAVWVIDEGNKDQAYLLKTFSDVAIAQ
jgi:hypothetical protein